jgi:hypothetical protein
MRIVIPQVVAENQELEKRLEAVTAARERGEFLKWFDRELKDIDPKLSLVKATEGADLPGLIPGYWHVKRENDATVDSYLPIHGPDGEFMEPHSGVFRDLRRADLHRTGALQDIRDRHARKARDRERLRSVWRNDKKQEFAERYKSLTSKQVLIP